MRNSMGSKGSKAAARAATAAAAAKEALRAEEAKRKTMCTWVHTKADGEREASFQGMKVDLPPLASFERKLHPDEFDDVYIMERIDGLRILTKRNEKVVSHFFNTIVTNTENLEEGSVKVVIRCLPYADVSIIQKPFNWRSVEQRMMLERVADAKTPFAKQNRVIL